MQYIQIVQYTLLKRVLVADRSLIIEMVLAAEKRARENCQKANQAVHLRKPSRVVRQFGLRTTVHRLWQARSQKAMCARETRKR